MSQVDKILDKPDKWTNRMIQANIGPQDRSKGLFQSTSNTNSLPNLNCNNPYSQY